LALFVTILAGSLNVLLWVDIGQYPKWMNIYPANAFSRVMYNLTNSCA